MVERYTTSVCIFADDILDSVLSVEQCMAIDNVCHRQEGHICDFFFTYAWLFTYSNMCVPFDEFTIGVLRILNVGSTKLRPNSWASLQAFHLLVEMFWLRSSPHVFLHFYSSRLASPVMWLSLVSQAGASLFTPFYYSYKYFKNVFFFFQKFCPSVGTIFLMGILPSFPLDTGSHLLSLLVKVVHELGQ